MSSPQTKLFVYCTYSILLRQTSQDMVIFSIGQSGFSRPSDQWCSLAVMENESILLQTCHVVPLLVPLGVQYVCGEHNPICIFFFYMYTTQTMNICAADTVGYTLSAWGTYQISYVWECELVFACRAVHTAPCAQWHYVAKTAYNNSNSFSLWCAFWGKLFAWERHSRQTCIWYRIFSISAQLHT